MPQKAQIMIYCHFSALFWHMLRQNNKITELSVMSSMENMFHLLKCPAARWTSPIYEGLNLPAMQPGVIGSLN